MYPKHTKYKIARTLDEYVDCLSLTEADRDLSHPTVMAVRDGKVIGMISTSRGEDSLFATPMKANNVFTCIRLWQLYERALSSLGANHYLFGIEKDNTKMINTVERLFNIKPFYEDKESKTLFYARGI